MWTLAKAIYIRDGNDSDDGYGIVSSARASALLEGTN